MKRTQTGWVFIAVIPLIIITTQLIIPPSEMLLLPYIILALILVLFYSLTITVDNEYVRFLFGIGLIKGKYRLEDIESCKSISYFPLGWGIRYRPGAILYNVSGNKAIELVIKGKTRKVWIGTNVPDELSEFINSKLSRI
jgi:hypothetical protein